jgi:hypothetical protein
LNDSIIYYTLHKTASSYFSNIALGNLTNLQHIDYENIAYFKDNNIQIDIELYNKAYGPIRLSNNPILKDYAFTYENLIIPFLNHPNRKNVKSIFQIRDPRDILVSNYYHQARGYKLNIEEETRKVQQQNIKEAQSMTIDEYLLKEDVIKFYVESFDTINKVYDEAEQKILLKYEDMINNWNVYIETLLSFVELEIQFIKQFHQDTRPAIVEDVSKHKRSGKTSDFKNKLKSSTIDFLNYKFESILLRYNYQF